MSSVSLQTLLPDFADQVSAQALEGITSDSRAVVSGGLFIACEGAGGHGLDYLGQALEKGASAVLWDRAGSAAPDVPAEIECVQVPGLADRVGDIADRFYDQPSASVAVTGITGTNGKTTTAWIAAGAARELGVVAGYMGTIGYGVAGELAPSPLTTPGTIAVHRRLREMANAGADRIFMEVSSHGLDQGRVDGVRFDGAAFTNLSRDHLDYHETYEEYGAAKLRLFTEHQPRAAVVNVGDEFGREIAGNAGSAVELLRVAVGGDEEADLSCRIISLDTDGLVLEFSHAGSSATVSTRLWGRFNAENLTVAAGTLLAAGFDLQNVASAFAKVTPPPGRMERLGSAHTHPSVVVDFAHTPDALRQALKAVREHSSSRIWVVFGCGGERDQGKRGAMGAIAARQADQVVLTNDNPRGEDPDAILADIIRGMPDPARAEQIPDRAAAISYAIHSAEADDVVLIAGKGSEAYQLIGNERLPFSDAEVARAALAGGV